MILWGGIDEAGYGPKLGPLVIAGTAFSLRRQPEPGLLWAALRDAVTPRPRGSGGRLVVNDSKQVYSPSAGLKRLEEGVLAFVQVLTGRPVQSGERLLGLLAGARAGGAEPPPWLAAVRGLALPLESNASAVTSKAAVLGAAMKQQKVHMLSARAAVVYTPEFNRIVRHTHNKSLLLFQKCGLLLQEFWRDAPGEHAYVMVDRHGGRKRYRTLLCDAFPGCACDVAAEEDDRSSYRIRRGGRRLAVSFREGADLQALPVALGSMVAKYVRELHMHAFNLYWQERLADLKGTAGYAADARRFLRDVRPALQREGVAMRDFVRAR